MNPFIPKIQKRFNLAALYSISQSINKLFSFEKQNLVALLTFSIILFHVILSYLHVPIYWLNRAFFIYFIGQLLVALRSLIIDKRLLKSLLR